MNSYLKQEDWAKIEREHPKAYAAIVELSLRREHNHLMRAHSLTDNQYRRLRELRLCFNLTPVERILWRDIGKHPSELT